MARGSLNKVMLIGHLGQDPDVRFSPSGVAWCSISVATNDRRKDNQSNEWQEHTEWHRVTLMGRNAEIAKEYLRKGAKVYIEGRLETNKYTDKRDNIERYQTRIIANDMMMMDNKGASPSASTGSDDYSYGGGSFRSNPQRHQPESFDHNSGNDYSQEPAPRSGSVSRPQLHSESSAPDDDVPF